MNEMPVNRLTRDAIEGGYFHRLIEASGLPIQVLSQTELDQSLSSALALRPSGTVMIGEDDVWLFAYGSLIWNPAFRHAESEIGTIHGWHRRFCLSTPIGRGSPDCPGLVLGLDRGGSCRGVVYRISAADVWPELRVVWRREMVTASYVPRWVQVRDGERTRLALTFTINTAAPNYTPDLTIDETAQRIATARGDLGPCSDYLHQTVDGLTRAGIRDVWMNRVQSKVALIAGGN